LQTSCPTLFFEEAVNCNKIYEMSQIKNSLIKLDCGNFKVDLSLFLNRRWLWLAEAADVRILRLLDFGI
jgi:hypothetical protein